MSGRFELLGLVRECPATVEGVKITGSNRLLLWAIALHADADSGEMFAAKDTLMDECGITHNTLDDALAELKSAGLITSRAQYNGVRRSNILTLNRVRLAAVARPERIRRSCVKALKELRRREVLTWPVELDNVEPTKECLTRLSKTPLQIRQTDKNEDARRVVVLTITVIPCPL
jgi:hypothetical protein